MDPWKQLLKLRTLAIRFIKPILGNGRRVSFCYDPWTPIGPLIQFIGVQGPLQLRVPLNSTVSDACRNENWCIPSPRTDEALDFRTYLTCIPCPAVSAVSDSYVWSTSAKEESRFNASNTWKDLRITAPIQASADLIWFKGAIPRNSFTMMWVATNMNRLPTKSRLASWGLNVPNSCCLCSMYKETRDHLFLSCDLALGLNCCLGFEVLLLLLLLC